MRMIVAECSAVYSGRGDTRLGKAVRAILIKEDGSVSIHNDVGNKPLNYMKTAVFTESITEAGTLAWTFDLRRESLTIYIHNKIAEVDFPLVKEDEGLVRDGTELHLQEWLCRNIEVLGEGFEFLEMEFDTGNGAVDILAKDSEGIPVAVEVKRVAMLPAVDQVRRYAEALKTRENPSHLEELDFTKSYGLIAALDVRPKTKELALKRQIPFVVIAGFPPSAVRETLSEGD